METILHDHNIELKCRICAFDFKYASDGIPIFKKEHLLEKIIKYVHININAVDKLSHLICSNCVLKIENFHNYALMAQKNQEIFNIMYSERIYREHCTALSSLNTTLYREPAPLPTQNPKTSALSSSGNTKPLSRSNDVKMQQQVKVKQPKVEQTPMPVTSQPQSVPQQQSQQQSPQQQTQQQVTLLSTEDITIFTYHDLKLGQIIKDQELLKLILRALKWNDAGKSIEPQLELLKNTSFRMVLSSPDLLHDEDLMQLLGPYIDHGAFMGNNINKPGLDYNSKMMEQNTVTEMEVGVDPELFFYDDEETKSTDQEEAQKIIRAKKDTRKVPPKNNGANNKSLGTVDGMPKIKVVKTSLLQKPAISQRQEQMETINISDDTELTVQTVPSQGQIQSQIQLPSPQPQPQKISQLPSSPNEPQLVVSPTPQQLPVPKPATEIPPETKPEPEKEMNSQSTSQKKVAPATKAVTRMTTKEIITRKPRKSNNEQAGVKTRAKSVFSSRFKCNICGKKLSTNGNLKVHLKTHKPKGKFNCDKCGRIFKTQANLLRHKEYHAGERFSCRTCGRVYPSNSTLKQHEIAHSNIRPHKCNICSKTFKRNQDLKFHINQHTGEKPYKCPFCPRAFASSGNCFSHRKRVHSDKTATTATASTAKRSSTATGSTKKSVKT